MHLEQRCTIVICRKDGKQKLFHYTLVREAGQLPRPGLRHDCQDKTACAECIRCWQLVKAAVVDRPAPPLS